MADKKKTLEEIHQERLQEDYEGTAKVEEIKVVNIKTGKGIFSDTILNNKTIDFHPKHS